MDTLFNSVQTERKTFDKPRFLETTVGSHIIRILEAPTVIYTHFINRSKVTIRCLGEGCPICENNKKIYQENPDTFRSIAAYSSRSPRHYVNVLDRTEVKVCPECQDEVKRDGLNKFPAVCKNGHVVINETPVQSNKVKIANISDTNAGMIKGYELSQLDADGNRIGILNFDLLLMVTKNGEKKVTVPMPLKENNDKVEVPADALYDLSKAVIELNHEEILELLRGVSLKDIFVSRRGAVVEDKLEEMQAEANQEVMDSLKTLFGQQ